jgi:hypothetical protein
MRGRSFVGECREEDTAQAVTAAYLTERDGSSARAPALRQLRAGRSLLG